MPYIFIHYTGMSITIAVQNNKAMQAYAKLKKQLQQDGITRVYRQKRSFMTKQQKIKDKVKRRVTRATAYTLAQARNVSSAS